MKRSNRNRSQKRNGESVQPDSGPKRDDETIFDFLERMAAVASAYRKENPPSALDLTPLSINCFDAARDSLTGD